MKTTTAEVVSLWAHSEPSLPKMSGTGRASSVQGPANPTDSARSSSRFEHPNDILSYPVHAVHHKDKNYGLTE